MDLRNIFDTYTSNAGEQARTRILDKSESLPGNVSYAIQNALNKDDDIPENDIAAPIPEVPAEEVFATPPPAEILENLSKLDSPSQSLKDWEQELSEENVKKSMEQEESELSDESPIEPEIPTENTDTFDIPEEHVEEFPIEENKEESFDDISFPDDISPTITEDDISSLEESISNDFSSEDSSTDEDFLSLFEGEAEADADDFDNIIPDLSNHEEITIEEPELSEEFEIENPDDLYIEDSTTETLEPEFEPTENDIPVFEPEAVSAPPVIDSIEEYPAYEPEFEPTEMEMLNNEARFDMWKDNETESNVSNIELSEDQIFTIRNRINEIKNKELRVELRNILIGAQYHAEYYDEVVSMLLINTPEETIYQFIKDHITQETLEEEDSGSKQLKEARSIFLAEDVEQFNNIRTELATLTKKISIYGFLCIFSGVLIWMGVARPLQSHHLFSKGLTSIQNGAYLDAEGYFQRATQIAGEHILKWYLKYADAYAEKSMVESAEKKYKQALILKPKSITAAIAITDFYTSLGPEFYPKAIDIMKTATSYYPKNFNLWDHYGSIYMELAKVTPDPEKKLALYQEAANIYKDFILKNIKNIAPYYKILDIYTQIGNPQQIQKIYSIIKKINPKYPNIGTLGRLAAYYLERKALNEAEEIFRHLNPTLNTAISNFPKIQKEMKKTYLIEPKTLSNDLGVVFYEYSRYQMLSSDVLNAMATISNSLFFNQKNSDAYNLLGEAHLIAPSGVNRVVKAKQLFEKASQLNKTNYKPQLNLGHIYFYWGQELENLNQAYADALYHYRIANTLKPETKKDYLLSYNLGWLEFNNHNYEASLNMWSDIYKDDPMNPYLSYALGSVLYKYGRPILAQVEFEKAVSIYQEKANTIPEPDPNNKRHTEIFLQLAKSYNNLGVINANYARANPKKRDYYEKEALLNFYSSKNIADQINMIYNNTEYNIGIITRPNIKNRSTEFDENIPKQTTLDNQYSEFRNFILEEI